MHREVRPSGEPPVTPHDTPMTFLGLPPFEWAIVVLLSALITIVGQLPERRGTVRGRRKRKG